MLQSTIRNVFWRLGYELVRRDASFSPENLRIINQVAEFTMSGPERITGLLSAVAYLVANRIEGDFVECGVWRGGSMMAAAHKLLALADTSRHLYLFDTFEGMTPPTAKDKAFTGEEADVILARTERKEGPGVWAIASRNDVQQNLESTKYPADQICFIQGKVEDTLPKQAPEKIALLRLDTDWYESTRHELVHLYPRLVPNGVLIIDDYGHWQGARQAVDEYFAGQKFKPLLNRLDYTGRLIVKPAT
jgi:O-methyltransferase